MKNMVRDCPSRDLFWTTFSKKNDFFMKKCAPGACFWQGLVFIKFWGDFWSLSDALEACKHQL